MFEQPDSNILFHSLHGIGSDGTYSYSEGLEQTVVALSVVRYITVLRLSTEM